jgi:hypothetical protein
MTVWRWRHAARRHGEHLGAATRAEPHQRVDKRSTGRSYSQPEGGQGLAGGRQRRARRPRTCRNAAERTTRRDSERWIALARWRRRLWRSFWRLWRRPGRPELAGIWRQSRGGAMDAGASACVRVRERVRCENAGLCWARTCTCTAPSLVYVLAN